MALQKKHLSLGKHNYKSILKEYKKFGWSISLSQELTTYTTETTWKGKFEYDDTLKIWAEENTSSSTTIEVDIYRYDEDIPMLWWVNILEFLHGLVNKIWWLVGLAGVFFTAYLIMEYDPDSIDNAGTVGIYILVFVIVWLIAKLLKRILSSSAEKIIENG